MSSLLEKVAQGTPAQGLLDSHETYNHAIIHCTGLNIPEMGVGGLFKFLINTTFIVGVFAAFLLFIFSIFVLIPSIIKEKSFKQNKEIIILWIFGFISVALMIAPFFTYDPMDDVVAHARNSLNSDNGACLKSELQKMGPAGQKGIAIVDEALARSGQVKQGR